MTQFEITWEAPEFEHLPKDPSWYWLSVIIATIILGLAVWQKNFLFGFFILIAEILILVWGGHEPKIIKFYLTEKRLTINNGKSYPLSNVADFSSEEPADGKWSVLVFRFKRHFAGLLRVIIPKERLSEIKKCLMAIPLPETEHEESFIETLQKFFRF